MNVKMWKVVLELDVPLLCFLPLNHGPTASTTVTVSLIFGVQVSLASAHLLRTLTSTVRPQSLANIAAFQSLFTQLESGALDHLQRTTYLVIFQSLSNHLLLPYIGTNFLPN